MSLLHSFFLPQFYSSILIHNNSMTKHYTAENALHSGACKFRNNGRAAMAAATILSMHPAADVQRRSANYKPSTWSYDYVQSFKKTHHHEVIQSESGFDTRLLEGVYEEERWKLLVEAVKHILDYDGDDSNTESVVLPSLELIDDIQRLGLGYHFEEDITRTLNGIFVSLMKNYDDQTITTHKSSLSLHVTALSFRLLRQHGYQVSQDVLKSFIDGNGSFKASLCKDVKAMLSLYEASHLGFEGESLLDEAFSFTTINLNECLRGDVTREQAEQVSHALELPLHRRMPRLETRWYIEAYSKRAHANQVLLELAKLDFNRVQHTLQRDLQDVSRWWKDLGLTKKLSFTRDRLMECYFWSVGMAFEPQFSNIRKGLTKVATLVTTIDDVYDVYGNLDELELFTSSVERWDVNAVEILPDYMKLCFLALYNTVNEVVYDILKEQGENVLPYMTKAWADLCKAFLKEKKWSENKYIPTFEEYLDNGWISVSGGVFLVHTYFLLNQKITDEALECLKNHHSLLRWPSLIFRLCNDLATSTAEVERGESANSISCSMRGGLVSEECARKCISNLIDHSWKNLNRNETSSVSPFTKEFVKTATNLARIAQCVYQYGDGHGAPDKRANNRIQSVIIDPV